MANKSGFILVDSSEASSMAQTAKNALSSSGSGGDGMSKSMNNMVKGLQDNAKKQQEAAAKELSENKKLGGTVNQVLDMVKRMKKEITDNLKEQKKIAEETLQQAAQSAVKGKTPSKQTSRSSAQDDGGSFDAGSFRKASQGAGGRKSTGASGDFATDAQMKGGIAIDLNGLSAIIAKNNQDLIEAFSKDRDHLIKTIEDQNNDIQATLIAGIGAQSGGKEGGGGGGSAGLESIAATPSQDKVFDIFRRDLLLGLQGSLDTFMRFQIPVAIMSIQQLNKEVNNLQGGMAGSVEKAREFRIETTNALQDIRRENGFTIEQIGNATTSVMGLGISGAKSIAEQTDVMLMGSRALGAEVGDVAQTYGLAARNLRLSVDQTRQMITGTIKVAEQTGLTARNVFEIRKEMQGFTDQLRRAGPLSAQLTNQLTKTQAIATQLGMGNFQQDFMSQFMDASKMGQVPDELALLVNLTRQRMADMDYSIGEIISGSFATSLQGQRDFATAAKGSLQQMRAMAQGSVQNLQLITMGLYKSFDEIDRAIMLQTRAAETEAERVDRLIEAKKTLQKLESAGLDLDKQDYMTVTGESSITGGVELANAIATAKGNIGNDVQDLAADVMKRTKDGTLSMIQSGIEPMEARTKAFEKAMKNASPLLSGKSLQEVQELSEKARARAIADEAKNAEAATDNMTDRVAKGVQKGIQMVTGPFSDLVDFFDSMGVGPFVAGVAMFGTAAIMLVSSIKGLVALLGGSKGGGLLKGLIGKTTGGEKVATFGNMMGGATEAAGGGGVAAKTVQAAGDNATAATSAAAATTQSLGNYVKQIGVAGRRLWKEIPSMLMGLAALTAVGLGLAASIAILAVAFGAIGVQRIVQTTAAIGATAVAMGVLLGAFYAFVPLGKAAQASSKLMLQALVGLGALAATGVLLGVTMRLMMIAFPPPKDALTLAAAIGASALAFVGLTAAFWVMAGTGLALNAIAYGTGGVGLIVLLASIAAGIGALALTAVIMGAAMQMMLRSFPNPEDTTQVAKAIGASAGAFALLAAAFFGITAVGLSAVLPMLLGPVGVAVVLGSIAAGVGILVGTALLLAEGMSKLKRAFRNLDDIEETGKIIESSAEALGFLQKAYIKIAGMGTLMALLPIHGILLPLAALYILSNFAEQLSSALVSIDDSFKKNEDIEATAKTITSASGAIGSLGEAYGSVIDSANLSWWKLGLDARRNDKSLEALLDFGKNLGPYMGELKTAFGEVTGMKEVAKLVVDSAEIIKSLGEASMIVNEYRKATNGWVTDITPEMINETMGDLTDIAIGMGTHIPTIVSNAPSESDANKLKSAATAMSSIASMMGTVLQMQKDFGEGRFTNGPMDEMDAFMINLGESLSDADGGFYKLKAGIAEMPDFRDDEVKKMNMLGDVISSVFDTLQILGNINDEIPNKSLVGRDMKSITETLKLTAGVFDQNIRPLKNLRNIMSMMPSDLGGRSKAFSTMFTELKNTILSIESIAKEFPQGGERSLGKMNSHLKYIANNFDQESIHKLSDTFDGVVLDLPGKIDSLAGGLERLPNLLMQVQKSMNRMGGRPALTKLNQDIQFMADALAPLGDLADALSFEAPNIEYFEREIQNLILTLGAAAQSIPEVFELRSEIQAKVKGKMGADNTTKTINDALTGPPGSGNTLSTGDGESMSMESSPAGVSMGGAESRLDRLISTQEETNKLMRQLLTALAAPTRVGSQTSGTAPRRTFQQAGATRQNVDSAWAGESQLMSP